MGRESAIYELELVEDGARALARHLDEIGVGRVREDGDRVDFCLRDPHRYWIDLRIDRGPPPVLRIRIALTNDTWSIRGPLERALEPVVDRLGGGALVDGDGAELAIAGADGWTLALEDDYGRRRDAFIARVGEHTAPISADHVYMYVHQTRWNRDNDDELAWHREREIAWMQEMWQVGELPEDADGPPSADAGS